MGPSASPLPTRECCPAMGRAETTAGRPASRHPPGRNEKSSNSPRGLVHRDLRSGWRTRNALQRFRRRHQVRLLQGNLAPNHAVGAGTIHQNTIAQDDLAHEPVLGPVMELPAPVRVRAGSSGNPVDWPAGRTVHPRCAACIAPEAPGCRCPDGSRRARRRPIRHTIHDLARIDNIRFTRASGLQFFFQDGRAQSGVSGLGISQRQFKLASRGRVVPELQGLSSPPCDRAPHPACARGLEIAPVEVELRHIRFRFPPGCSLSPF